MVDTILDDFYLERAPDLVLSLIYLTDACIDVIFSEFFEHFLVRQLVQSSIEFILEVFRSRLHGVYVDFIRTGDVRIEGEPEYREREVLELWLW